MMIKSVNISLSIKFLTVTINFSHSMAENEKFHNSLSCVFGLFAVHYGKNLIPVIVKVSINCLFDNLEIRVFRNVWKKS